MKILLLVSFYLAQISIRKKQIEKYFFLNYINYLKLFVIELTEEDTESLSFVM